MVDRYPQSRFERFCSGLQVIKAMQARADFCTKDGSLYLRCADPELFGPGRLKHLAELGFKLVDNNFIFILNEQQT